MDEPIIPGLGAEVVRILANRDGQMTMVELDGGTFHEVYNVAWGRDMGEKWEHIHANVSPEVPDSGYHLFSTADVVRLISPGDGITLWSR